jgi:hypothetical protein
MYNQESSGTFLRSPLSRSGGEFELTGVMILATKTYAKNMDGQYMEVNALDL